MNTTLQSIFLLIWGLVCLSFGWTFVGYFTIVVAIIVFVSSFAKKKQTDVNTEQSDIKTEQKVDMEKISKDEAELLFKKNIYKFRLYKNYWKENDINYYNEVYEAILNADKKNNKKKLKIFFYSVTLLLLLLLFWIIVILPTLRKK